MDLKIDIPLPVMNIDFGKKYQSRPGVDN